MASESRAIAAGLAALLLSGCPSSQSSSTNFQGRVVDMGGQPYSGQTVILSSGSVTRKQVTDADGGFSVEGVPTPYTATVLDSAGNLASVYQGLTRTDPTLTDLVSVSYNRSATVTGLLTGGTYPEPSDDTTFIAFVSPDTVQFLASQSVATYESAVRWYGPATTTGTLYAIQIHYASGPADYLGYGTRDNVALQDMGTLTGQDVTLSPVTTGTLSGTVTAPTGYALQQKVLQLVVAPGAAIGLAIEETATATFSYTTPSIDGTSLLLAASGSGPAGEYAAIQKTVSANASNVELSLPAAPALSLPLEGATGVTPSTEFSWTAFPSGVHLFQVYGGGPTFLVVTAATTATLPNLAPEGLGVPASASYQWDVIGFAPVASVDAVAAPGGLNQLFYGDLTEARTPQRSFTTAP